MSELNMSCKWHLRNSLLDQALSVLHWRKWNSVTTCYYLIGLTMSNCQNHRPACKKNPYKGFSKVCLHQLLCNDENLVSNEIKANMCHSVNNGVLGNQSWWEVLSWRIDCEIERIKRKASIVISKHGRLSNNCESLSNIESVWNKV